MLVLRLLLAGVFAVAGVAKLRDVAGSRRALEEFGLPARLSPVGALLLPLAELVIAFALLLAPRWGAIAAIALLAIFVAGIANAMVHDRAPDCHCFGQLHSEPAGKRTLVRNGVLILMGGAVVALGPGPSIHTWVAERSGAELIVLAMVLGGGALASPKLLAWDRRRQEHLRHARLVAEKEDRERPAGRPVGSDAVDFALRDVDGAEHTLAGLCGRGQPVALVFVHPKCGPCHAMLPDLATWQDLLAERLTIAVVSEGSTEDNRAFRDQYDFHLLLVQERSEVYFAYEFRLGTPAAVIVDPDRRIASVAVSGAIAIEELIRAALHRIDTAAHPNEVT